MKAQTLYDLRDQYAFCSGTDLHEFFNEQVGDPSPSGYAEISHQAAAWLVENCYEVMLHNSPSMTETLVSERAAVRAALR